MAGAGTGSTLMLRIADGMRRMKAANAIGLSRPFAAQQTNQPFQGTDWSPGNAQAAQPPVAATVDVPMKDKMRAEAESFLSGMAQVTAGITSDPSNKDRL